MLKPAGKSFAAISWHDPHGTGKAGCLTEHEMPHECILVTTYGWLMRKDEKGVSVVGEIIGDGSMRDYTYVPRELIDEIAIIHIPTKRRRVQAVVRAVGEEKNER